MSIKATESKKIKALECPHFPTKMQAIVWRNWEMVEVERIAKILETNEENILQLANEMGLSVPPKVNKYWLERGYVTLIRANWHLLTYDQLLILLDWTEEKLEFTLKEDDFLSIKLGSFKPYVEPAIYKPLSDREKQETKKIREMLKNHFDEKDKLESEEPFEFLNRFKAEKNNCGKNNCEKSSYGENALQGSETLSSLDITESDMPRIHKFAYRFIEKMHSEWGVSLEVSYLTNNINDDADKNDILSNENLQIELSVKADSSLPAESHRIEIEDEKIIITSVDEVGILRGLQWVEKQICLKEGLFTLKNIKNNATAEGNATEGNIAEGNIAEDNLKEGNIAEGNVLENDSSQNDVPFANKKIINRKTRFELRYIYSYFAVYGDALLEPENDPYPDALLSSLSEIGVNGVWLQGVLYNLVPWDKAPELSLHWEKRIDGLRKIVKRARDYGIGVYLYLNEPRAMPEEFFDERPDWKGATHYGLTAICTSHKDIQEYLYNSVSRLFVEVPDLAGIFTITMSENFTNCYSKIVYDQTGNKPDCPLCSKRSHAEVIAEVNNIIAQGVHSVKPEARVIAWTWGWHSDWADEAISLLNKDIMVMCTSEEAMPTNIAGIKGEVIDYTMSMPGPGLKSTANWEKAAKSGHKTIAKVQFNNTWECSAVPYLPVMNILEQHINNLNKQGLNGILLSWTLGGYPSMNLDFASQFYWEEEEENKLDIKKYALQNYGDEVAPYIQKAWATFSDAFKEFPFNVGVLYNAPQTYGPMNLLHEAPTGYSATMLGLPYDDIKNWRRIYPEDAFESQFFTLRCKWKDGIEYVKQAKSTLGHNEQVSSAIIELENVAVGAYCHFQSTYLQIRFVRLRNKLLELKNNDEKDIIIRDLISVIDEEIEMAKMLYEIMKRDSRIGFEASNHYYYTDRALKEKVINCEYIKEKYLKK